MSEILGPRPEEREVPSPIKREKKFDPRRMGMKITAATGMLVGLFGIGGRLPRVEAAPAPQAGLVETRGPQERLMRERAIDIVSTDRVFRASHPEAVRVEVDEQGVRHEYCEGKFDPNENLGELVRQSPKLSSEVNQHQGEKKGFRERVGEKVKEVVGVAEAKAKGTGEKIKNVVTIGLGRIFGLSSGSMKEPVMIGKESITRINTAGELAWVVSETSKEFWSQLPDMPESDRTTITQTFINAAAEVGVAGAQEAGRTIGEVQAGPEAGGVQEK